MRFPSQKFQMFIPILFQQTCGRGNVFIVDSYSATNARKWSRIWGFSRRRRFQTWGNSVQNLYPNGGWFIWMKISWSKMSIIYSQNFIQHMELSKNEFGRKIFRFNSTCCSSSIWECILQVDNLVRQMSGPLLWWKPPIGFPEWLPYGKVVDIQHGPAWFKKWFHHNFNSLKNEGSTTWNFW